MGLGARNPDAKDVSAPILAGPEVRQAVTPHPDQIAPAPMSVALAPYDEGALVSVTASTPGSSITDGRSSLLGFFFGPNPCTANGIPEMTSLVTIDHHLAPACAVTWNVTDYPDGLSGWGRATATVNEGYVNCP